VALALSFLLPHAGALSTEAGALRIDPPPQNLWLLGLPCAAFVVVPVLLATGGARARALAVSTGVVVASALWSWILCVRVLVPAVAVDGLSTSISGTFHTALWLRLAAAVAFTIAGAVLLGGWREAGARLGLRRDLRAYVGALVVFGGAMLLPIGLAAADKTSEAVAGGWAQVVIFWLVFVPLAALRLNRVQRDIAVATTVAFTVFAGARALSVTGPSDYRLAGTGAGVMMLVSLLTGVLVSQLGRNEET
jgi:hypothetical protein